MAGPCLSNGLFVGNHVHLTPPLFRRLDLLARTHACIPIDVFDWHEKPKFWGYVSPMAGSVRIKADEIGCREMITISLSSRIPLDEFYAKESGFELSAVPPEDVYPFIVWHEIHHVRHADQVLIFEADMATNRNTLHAVTRYTEFRAWRLAWESMYPGKPHPWTAQGKAYLAEMEDIRRDYAFILAKFENRKPRAPIPLAANEYVPLHHVKEGYPWTPEVEAVVAAKLAA